MASARIDRMGGREMTQESIVSAIFYYCEGQQRTVNPRSCCGRMYAEQTWGDLHYVGDSHLDDGGYPSILEYRDCPCGSRAQVEI